MVMGDLGQVAVLLPPGADAHDYQLRPSQARMVESADLQVWIGPELAPWMGRAQETLGKETPSLQLLEVKGTDLLMRDSGDSHEDHGPIDPHAWLDPANARLWLTAIATQLAQLDPEHAAIYQANSESAGQSIATMQADLTLQLAPYTQANFVVQHDAYGYFTRAFGLKDAVAVALNDASQPSAARLRKIGQDLTALNVTCAFPEQNHNDRLLRAAIEGSHVRLASALDPEGSAIEQGADLYPSVLKNIARALQECLSE